MISCVQLLDASRPRFGACVPLHRTVVAAPTAVVASEVMLLFAWGILSTVLAAEGVQMLCAPTMQEEGQDTCRPEMVKGWRAFLSEPIGQQREPGHLSGKYCQQSLNMGTLLCN